MFKFIMVSTWEKPVCNLIKNKIKRKDKKDINIEK